MGTDVGVAVGVADGTAEVGSSVGGSVALASVTALKEQPEYAALMDPENVSLLGKKT